MQKNILILCALASSLYLSAQETFPDNGAPHVDHTLYVIRGAVIHSDYQTTRTGADLWVRDGRIQRISQGEAIPFEASIMEMPGAHIYPSFIDLYSEYGLSKAVKSPKKGPQMERNIKGAMGWNEAIRPETRAKNSFKHNEKQAELLRKSGFGTVLSHHADGIIRGTGVLSTLDDESENRSILLADAAQFMSFEKGTSNQDYPSSKMGSIALIRQTLYDMQWYSRGGDKEEINLSLESLSENMRLPQFFISQEKNDILRADNIGSEFNHQFIFIGSGNEYERAQDIRSAGGMVVLPLTFPSSFDLSDPFLSSHIPLHDLRHWEQAPSNAVYLTTSGIEISFTAMGLQDIGTFITNVRKTVEHGLSRDHALKALTYNPAKALGLENELGIVREKAFANFIVCDGDLFDKNTRVLENWIQGKRYSVDPSDYNDITGAFDFNMDGKHMTFEVNENSKGVILPDSKKDTSQIRVKIKEDYRQVNLQFEMKDVGIYRLHGIINSRLNIWDGSGESPSGERVKWNAIKKGEITNTPIENVVIKHDKVSRLKYPNNGYGWSERPMKENVLIRDATVWTNTEQGIMKDADVLVMDGRIIAVGHNLKLNDILPKGKVGEVKSINAYGKHVTCGIIDEHSHIAVSHSVNESGQASSAEVRIGDVIDPEDISIYRQLAGGVTAAQLLHGSANPIGGQSALIKLRWGSNAEEMKISAAPKFIKFALGENVKQSNWGDDKKVRFPQTRMGVEQVYYDHFHRARKYSLTSSAQPSGSGFLGIGKKTDLGSGKRKDLELEALSEVLLGQRFITCHSYVQSEVNMLMNVADSMGFKVNTFTHILEGYKIADKMKEHGVGGSTFSDWWAYKYEVREATPYNAALMHDEGITVAINSDDPEMGRRLNQEAAKGVKYGGMSEEEAWKMVTLNPAKLLHLDHRMGSLAPKKDADVVIWSGHPLSIYSQVECTFVDGVRYFDRKVDARKRKDIRSERARLIQKMLGQKDGEEQAIEFQEKEHYQCNH